MKFMSRARWLYRIVLFQKAARLLLRAAWLGGAVYLLSWGIDSLWGVLPNPDLWVLFSAVVGLFTLLTIFRNPMKFNDFLWRVDQNFANQEQATTAHQVAVTHSGKSTQPESVEAMLLVEAGETIPPITRKVIDMGWNLRNDVEAAVIVLMLLMVVYLSGMETFFQARQVSGLGLFPGAGSDPSFLDLYPSGIPGDTDSAPAGLLSSERESRPEEQDDFFLGLTEEELDEVYEVFQQIGTMLKDEAAAADFGRALEDINFQIAADELSSLSESVDRLGPESRTALAEAFSFGQLALYQPEYEGIASVLSSAANALVGESLTETSSQLDRLSDLLEDLAFISGGGRVFAWEDFPEPQPQEDERIVGDGEEIELEAPEDISNLLAIPGSGRGGGDDVLGDAVDLFGISSTGTEGNILVPYNFYWDDFDVVSSYFSPR